MRKQHLSLETVGVAPPQLTKLLGSALIKSSFELEINSLLVSEPPKSKLASQLFLFKRRKPELERK